MKITLLSLFVLITSTAFAQVSGTYNISYGQGLDGSTYGGAVHLEETYDGTVHLAWETSDGSAYSGIGLTAGNEVWAGWGTGNNYGVAVYSFENGNLSGTWVDAQERVGQEVVHGGASMNGTYSVTGTNPDGTYYEGSLFIVPAGETYQFVWETGNFTYTGVGYRVESSNTFVVGWAYGENSGVVHYDFSGSRGNGKWAVSGSHVLGIENIQK